MSSNATRVLARFDVVSGVESFHGWAGLRAEVCRPSEVHHGESMDVLSTVWSTLLGYPRTSAAKYVCGADYGHVQIYYIYSLRIVPRDPAADDPGISQVTGMYAQYLERSIYYCRCHSKVAFGRDKQM